MSTEKLVGGQRSSRKFIDGRLDDHDDRLDGHDSDRDDLRVAVKWLTAKTTPTVHMEVDFEGLLSLSPLPSNATQAQANARANALKVAWNAHLAGVGTVLEDGEHLAADTANAVATIDASSVDTCEALVIALLASIIGHGDETGVHFSDDTGAGGTGATMTEADPETLPDLISDLNDLKTAMTTHMDLGTTLPW